MAAGAGLTRRRFLGAAGAATGGLAVGAGGALALGAGDDGGSPAGTGRVPFEGAHQAGIVTPAQDRLHIAAFDVVSDSREDVRDLLRAWTDAARALTAGRRLGAPGEAVLAPPQDTGEADGLHPSRLTITFGLGPSLFDERFGLAGQRPAALRDLPPLPGDELDPRRSGGDLCVQACSDDPQVAFHAVRNLARIGRGTVVMRWSQLGFGRTSTTSRAQDTPRNLMGFKDGTNNLRAEDAAGLREHVWVGDEAPAWMRGGTYMVTRRIRMLIEVWDRTSLAEQEATFGRVKDSGAPLGETREHDPVPLRARGPDGAPRIDPRAHIRLAAPSEHGGVRILRRGYSFTDGFDAELGQLDAGLFFIAFQRDAHRQFVALQERLGRSDKLNEYIKHVSSGVFAVPGGVGPRGFVAQGLFEA
jgi:deferrochelatase/peroxidase EfeB